MDTTTAALVLIGLTTLFLYGVYLGYGWGRSYQQAVNAEDRADASAIEAALAKTRRQHADAALKNAEAQDTAARLRAHGEWIEAHPERFVELLRTADRHDTQQH
jgi:hypothetical protein